MNKTLSKKMAFAAIAWLSLSLSQVSQAFVPGVDYQLLDLKPIPAAMLPSATTKIKVVEFFSYGCPWCYKLDPAIVAWEKTKPANVEFIRVPVDFQSSWSMFSKIFYVAQDLGVEARLHQNLFSTVQTSYPEDPAQKNTFSLITPADFSTNQGIRAYFVTQGIKPPAIDAVLNDEKRLNNQLVAGLALGKACKITEIPTVIVDGKYLISNRYTNGDNQKFIATLNYLINSK